jgi:hypothetical protein
MVLKAPSSLEQASPGTHLAKDIKANRAHPGVISHFLGFSAHDSGSDVSDY